ncbi:hypothetical protein GCM10009613_26570 [Pseudonocardia kongjuensis]|uniref:Transposase IS701-like DDE domain-containing protein n=1 Tax=Pseudonocardia kongjuensis TaxID=102227 RepID=A0ABP4IJ69_9PSEU
MVGRGRAERAFTELAANVVDDDNGVAALVCVDPENHHESVSLSSRSGRQDRPAGIAQWGPCHAPIKPRRSVQLARPAAQGDQATNGTKW